MFKRKIISIFIVVTIAMSFSLSTTIYAENNKSATTPSTTLSNNIKGVKVIDLENDMKSFWKTRIGYPNITLNKFLAVDFPVYISYENLDCIQIFFCSHNWGKKEKEITKEVLKYTVQNPQEIYNKADKLLSEMEANNHKIPNSWGKENIKTFYTGDVKYTISLYTITCENKVEKNNIVKINEDGTAAQGVLKVDFWKLNSVDLSKNPYLVKFMEENFSKEYYNIAAHGVSYSSWYKNMKTTSNATIFNGAGDDYDCWNICIQKFNDGEKKILQALLKVMTSDSSAVYTKFIEMDSYDGPSKEAIMKKYKFGTWQKVANTYYMFDESSQYIILRIKF